MGIIETQLKHVGYELDMLVYTFDKLLLVELGDCRMASEKPATVLSEIAPRTELLGAAFKKLAKAVELLDSAGGGAVRR